jgi:hypothetical protein
MNDTDDVDGYYDRNATMIPFDTITEIYFDNSGLLITTEENKHYKFNLNNSSINCEGITRQIEAFRRIVGVE